jgi:hypothetical protein
MREHGLDVDKLDDYLSGTDEQLEEDYEPCEGDLVTYDHRRVYEWGCGDHSAFLVGEDEDFKAACRKYMDENRFWPNVWFISDHGNCHLLEVYSE